MKAWAKKILHEFPSDLSRLWIASDPDGVLLDEQILSELRERGFEVLPFEDSVASGRSTRSYTESLGNREMPAQQKPLYCTFRAMTWVSCLGITSVQPDRFGLA